MVCANKFLPITLSFQTLLGSKKILPLPTVSIFVAMAKLKHLLSAILLLTTLNGFAQSYVVTYTRTDSGNLNNVGLKTLFASAPQAAAYLSQLPSILQAKGYVTAALDSVRMDSAGAAAWLFLGNQYRWAQLVLAPQHQNLLQAAGWNYKAFEGVVNFSTLQQVKTDVLNYLEEHGYPFARVFLDSIRLSGQSLAAMLNIQTGRLYHFDSIRVYGNANISNRFLQQYLDIKSGSVYNKKKLAAITEKLEQLNYLEEEQPANVSMLATGSIVNLYLKPKKTSQVNALIGFLPNSSSASGSQKLQLTVDANILLQNALGGGETFGLLWQQLQQSSPRLNLLFQQPFIFRSPFQLRFSFDMYKQDSSYLNLNMNLGAGYQISLQKNGSVFLQHQQTIINTINAQKIIQTRRLPQEADVSSMNLGISYNFNSTDYRPNPRKGISFLFTATAGTKKIKKNAQILELKDPADPSFSFEGLYDTVKPKMYQFRMAAAADKYLPLGTQSALKLGLNAGWFQSETYFRNELFRLGGYKQLRGFDEESQYVSRYAIGTIEYRYLIGRNAAFFVFVDGGFGKHLLEAITHHSYIGTGAGLSFETGAGIINLAWAVGKRNDGDFNLRQSKLHIGFASYF